MKQDLGTTRSQGSLTEGARSDQPTGDRTVSTSFFHFNQNNSGGHFTIDDERGLGPSVWVEAVDAAHANSRAESIGIYFNGCEGGSDCECCGDRWSPAWREEGSKEVEKHDYSFSWHDTIYVHLIDGTIQRLKAEATS